MPGAIILGAGRSRRFGDDKRQATLADGDMVIAATIRRVAASLDAVVVALRASDQAFASKLDAAIGIPHVRYFLAPDSDQGMAHSLGNAIGQVKDWDGAMVFLADMPFIKPGTIAALQQSFNDNADLAPIVVPTFEGSPGHPVTFHRTYFGEIAQLTGDRGAKTVVGAHPRQVIKVPVVDVGVVKDIDTPGDL